MKRYIVETQTNDVLTLWNHTQVPAASRLLFAAVRCAFARRLRESPDSAELIRRAKADLVTDWAEFYRIEVDDLVDRRVQSPLQSHALRAGDAIHLASAMLFRDAVPGDTTFACADGVLANSARAEGFTVVP